MNITDIDLQKENDYLKVVIKQVKAKISALGQELYDKEEKIQEFQKFIWDTRHEMDPSEMRTMMSSSDLEITLIQNKGKYLRKLFRTQNSPYFGSITFKEKDSIPKKVYIGIARVEDEENDIYLVHDWRAPICSMFYDFETGPAYYKAPEGTISGEIVNKRQFKIEHGILKRIFDNNLNIDDDLLQEVLASKSNEKMKNIVNTIQQEQNAIIRNLEDRTLIVQGIAGSGKTSVALHRIAFLLYKIENLNSKNVLIFSPNQVFTEYISNVLPELGEDNTMQTTFHDFLSKYLPEYKTVESFTTFVERYYKYKEANRELVKYKQSDRVILDISLYIKRLLKEITFTSNIEIENAVYTKQELNDLLYDRYSKLLFFDRINAIADKICNDIYGGRKAKRLSIISTLKKNLSIKLDFKKILKDFFRSDILLGSFKGNITEKEINNMVNTKDIKYEDACLLVYLKGLLEGFDYFGTIREVVIDEAQDYNKIQYLLIKTIFRKSGFTILGDINQTINPYYKYNSLNDLEEIFKDRCKYLELNKTYRSTKEIIEHTNKILGLSYVSAIRRENSIPVIMKRESNIKENLKEDIERLRKTSNSVAIITKTDEEADYLYNLLVKDLPEISQLSANTKEFNKQLVIVPAYIAKGLEFDSTIIYTGLNNQYKEDEKYLYYVACTRAQHQLIIYNQ